MFPEVTYVHRPIKEGNLGHLCVHLDDTEEISIEGGRIVVSAYPYKGSVRVLIVCDKEIAVRRQPRQVTRARK